MSKEAALAFLQKVAQDAELQQKLVLFAKEQGYEFSVDELTDSDLDKVAGGLINTFKFAPDAGHKLDTSYKISDPLGANLDKFAKF